MTVPVGALGLPGALVAVPLEVKNVRDWLYPRAPEVHQVLSKAAQLQLARPTTPIVPVLIARRIHTTTFRMFEDLGALGQQTKRQYIGAFDYTVICEEPGNPLTTAGPTVTVEGVTGVANLPAATRTALVVAVPAAEAVVGAYRRDLDRAVGWGVPAHVTVLSPFLEPDAVDEAALAAVAAAVATVDAFECTFATTGRFGAEVLWLAPDPDGPLRCLTAAVWAAFPGNPPYGGAFADVVPHLTVGEGALGEPGALDIAEAAVRPRLPVVQRVEEVLLIAGAEEPRSWRTRHRFPLGRG